MEFTNFFFIHGSSCEDYQQSCYNLAAIGDPAPKIEESFVKVLRECCKTLGP